MRIKARPVNWRILLGAPIFAMAPLCAFGQVVSPTPVPPVANACARFIAGSVVHQPPALFSQNGVLNVTCSRRLPACASASS